MAGLPQYSLPKLGTLPGEAGIPGMEALAMDSGMMNRAALGALMARDPMAAAKILVGMGASPGDFLQETASVPGVPGAPLVELLDHRSQLEDAKDIAADPGLSDLYHRITILRGSGVIPPKGQMRGIDTTPLGTPKYSLTPPAQPKGPALATPATVAPTTLDPVFDAILNGTQVHKGKKGQVTDLPVNTPDSPAGIDPFSPAAVTASEAGVSQTTPLMLPPAGPPAASPPGANAPPPIPKTAAAPPAAPPVAPDVQYLKKVLNGEDPGQAPYIPGMGQNDAGGYSPVETLPAAPSPSSNQGPELVGQGNTGPGPTNSSGGGADLASLLAALQGVQAPESPKVTPPYTPPPPEVKVPQGSKVAELLDAIFGSGMGKRASGPSSLSAALRG